MNLIRFSASLFVLLLGFVLPSWLFVILLVILGLYFVDYWESILVMVVLNIVFVHSSASFQAIYVVVGVGVFLLSLFAHRMTRFKNTRSLSE